MQKAIFAWQQAIANIRDPFSYEVEVCERGQSVRVGHMHRIGFRDTGNNPCGDATNGDIDRIVATYGSASEVIIKLDDTALPRVEGSKIIYEDDDLQFVLRPEIRQPQAAA